MPITPASHRPGTKQIHCVHYPICGEAVNADYNVTRVLCGTCVAMGREMPKIIQLDLTEQAATPTLPTAA